MFGLICEKLISVFFVFNFKLWGTRRHITRGAPKWKRLQSKLKIFPFNSFLSFILINNHNYLPTINFDLNCFIIHLT